MAISDASGSVIDLGVIRMELLGERLPGAGANAGAADRGLMYAWGAASAGWWPWCIGRPLPFISSAMAIWLAF